MGQANQRGSKQLRVDMAIARNEQLEKETLENKSMTDFRMRNGTQRLATRLVAAGIIGVPILVQSQK